MKNRVWRLKSRPTGEATLDNFSWAKEDLRSLNEGEVLIANRYISLDPTHRIWMSDMDQYMPPLEIGETIRSLGIGEVIESRSQHFKPGDWVETMTGWQDYCIHSEGDLQLLPVWDVPKSAFLSVLGLTGLTAYFGLFKVAAPKPGETIVVSGARGAVGTIVGQLAKIHGLTVLGIAGSEQKVQELKEIYHFDQALNYKSPQFPSEFKRLTPQGVDVYFDNVGGEISDVVWDRMNLFGRVSLCGMIATYNSPEPARGPKNFAAVLMKRLTVRGFILFDFVEAFPKARSELYRLVAEGKIKYQDDIVEGLENAPSALNKLFTGANTGKLMIKV